LTTLEERLKTRIAWARLELEDKEMTDEKRSDWEWFLQHLISLQTAEDEHFFTFALRDVKHE